VMCFLFLASLLFFLQVYSESKVLYLEKDPNFLVCAAILYINMSYVFIEFFSESMVENGLYEELSFFHITTRGILYFIYIFGIISAMIISGTRENNDKIPATIK